VHPLHPVHPPTAAPPSVHHARRRADLPLGFVMLALVALVALPLAVDRYAAPLHDDMGAVAEPGRGLVTRVHLALALEHASLRDYAATRDPAARARYARSAKDEAQAYARLEPLSRRLGPSVHARLAELRELQAEWHRAAEAVFDGGAVGRTRGETLDEAELYERTLVGAARLDEAIQHVIEQRRASIVAAEQVERRIAVVLGVVALAAAAVVASLGRRVHAFAAEAERRRLALERATESRARLMRGLSHDLKNPLGAIDGHAALLADGVLGPLAPPQAASVSRIRGAVRSLLTLVSDLLELSRAEEGQLALRPEATDLAAVVQDVVEEQRAAALAAGHTLDVRVAASPPPLVTDQQRVRQILGNLLSNAIKYTPAGGRIEVLVQPVPSGRARGTGPGIAVRVTDSGPGIPAGREEEVFAEFTRLDTTGKPGAGLGLAIARRIARLLGGDITVHRAETGGAAFELWLPESAAVASATAAPAADGGASRAAPARRAPSPV
jgi:signal transduction histidine kinase